MKNDSCRIVHAEQQRRNELWLKEPFILARQALTPVESQQLIHQLQLRTIELELQNHALSEACDRLEERLEKYTHLYDIAPIGYATLNRKGAVQEINLSGALLLGIAQNCLIDRPFGMFVSAETLPVFNIFLHQLMSGTTRESCEVVLASENASPRYMRLEGSRLGPVWDGLCHVVMLDITGYKQTGELLKLSEARYQAIIESQNDLICRFLPDGALTFVNQAYCRYFGYSYEDLLAANFMSVIPEEVWSDGIAQTRACSADFPLKTYEHQVVRADGAARWVHWITQAIFDSDHHLIEIQSIGRDMTEQHLKDEMLRNNEERYRRIVETAQEGIWLVDAQGCITFVNVRMAEMLGCTVEEMLGQPLCDFMDEEWRTMATHWLEHRRPGIVEQHDIKFRRKEGGEVWVLGSINAFVDAQNRHTGALGMMVDITDRKRMEEELRQLSILDPLTGLFNRRHFFAMAGQEFERSQRYSHPMAVLMLDVDHFKSINDTFGHQAGDQILQAVARIMRDTLRGADLLGRYGGEEFVMLLPETSLLTAVATANRLCAALSTEPIATDKGPWPLTVSIGVAALMDHAELSLDRLLDWADQALYGAKQAGRNQVHAWAGCRKVAM
ncbi:MAG: diguanylate cyclase [Candidatus Competibacteraceae bacterium]